MDVSFYPSLVPKTPKKPTFTMLVKRNILPAINAEVTKAPSSRQRNMALEGCFVSQGLLKRTFFVMWMEKICSFCVYIVLYFFGSFG